MAKQAISQSITDSLPYALRGKRPRGAVKSGIEDPAAYATRVSGNCMAPLLCHNDVVILSPSAKPERGSIVLVSPNRPGERPIVKRLVSDLPRKPIPGDEVVLTIRLEMDNPKRHIFVPMDRVDRVHVAVAVVRLGEYIVLPRGRQA